jgi:quinol monooxygenase YgiN
MAEHATVVRITRFRPNAAERDQVLGRLQEGAEAMRQLDGCFGSQICSSRESPDEIVAVSRWASQAALDAFLQQSVSQRAELARSTTSPPSSEHLDSL